MSVYFQFQWWVELKQDLFEQAKLLELPQEVKPLLRLLQERSAVVIPGKGTWHGGAQELERVHRPCQWSPY